ncbi:exodeoxyribonuclease V gamma subunit domain protein [Mycobacterium xenopi 4042]|uniref:Exodeoxyribonuclease V gamma subunit domain protein n=1 Tax=Mycobacterium xenopi 4042 TaxID=1299334 RepID=X8BK61_MYCXE|nr:exodeoxyribonuclease V gamma subunit domain protein [Mycobacterium xenopi 4042]
MCRRLRHGEGIPASMSSSRPRRCHRPCCHRRCGAGGEAASGVGGPAYSDAAMALHLHRAERTDLLADGLARLLSDPRPTRSPRSWCWCRRAAWNAG